MAHEPITHHVISPQYKMSLLPYNYRPVSYRKSQSMSTLTPKAVTTYYECRAMEIVQNRSGKQVNIPFYCTGQWSHLVIATMRWACRDTIDFSVTIVRLKPGRGDLSRVEKGGKRATLIYNYTVKWWRKRWFFVGLLTNKFGLDCSEGVILGLNM